jgi:hypothetical protein
VSEQEEGGPHPNKGNGIFLSLLAVVGPPVDIGGLVAQLWAVVFVESRIEILTKEIVEG